MSNVLDFERPIAELDANISRLRSLTGPRTEEQAQLIAQLEQRRRELLEQIFAQLTPWDRVLLARHPQRPYSADYIQSLIDEFTELHGDRLAADDRSIIGGIGWFRGVKVVVIGQQKGRDLKERQLRNFGMSRPEGYRKAMRLMTMAERFQTPVITLVDTPAADPGVESESRGISWAIAESLCHMSSLRVPVVTAIIGEGGSGGALGIAVSNSVLMQENAIYSVIPPEGCAAILWRNPNRASEAASALRLTAADALTFGIIDGIISEPLGGAHRDPTSAAQLLGDCIFKELSVLEGLSGDELASRRYARFRKLGFWTDSDSGTTD